MNDFIANTDDTISLDDVIERIEELREAKESLREQFDSEPANEGVDFDNWVRNQVGFSSEEFDELQTLESLLSECEGCGGDVKFEGTWYPSTLIRDSYFQDYAQELAEETGAIKPDASWPNNCIDWEFAARELQHDYTGIEFDGVTYYCR